MQTEVAGYGRKEERKMRRKIEHLGKVWRKGKRQSRSDLERADGTKGCWRGMQYGDKELRQKAESEGRDFKKNKPQVYSKVEITKAESKMKIAAEIMNAKIKMEMKARQNREEGECEWREDWEVRQQEEKTVYGPHSNTLNFEKRRVTNMAICRSEYPPTAHQLIRLLF